MEPRRLIGQPVHTDEIVDGTSAASRNLPHGEVN